MTIFDFEPITAEALRAEGTGSMNPNHTRKTYTLEPPPMKFQVVIGTPFGTHIEATFDTEREAWAYIDEKQPFQNLRMLVREVLPEPNVEAAEYAG